MPIEPELRLHLEISAEPQRRIGGNRALAAHDGADAQCRYANVNRQLVLADAEENKELLLQNLPGM